MIKFTATQYEQMSDSLADIAIQSTNKLQLAEHSFKVVNSYVLRLKEFVVNHTFSTNQEEIRFFKEIKPAFLKQLIFYKELFDIEAKKPVGDKEAIIAYYRKCILGFNAFFERNKDLYIYYRTGKVTFDDAYFRRDASDPELMSVFSIDMDTRFGTVQSFKLSEIQAFEMLNEHVQAVINEFEGAPVTEILSKSKTSLTWTDSKVAAIELIYAIQFKGSVNHGRSEIRQLVNAFEETFNIRLGNVYAVFQQNIRIRKKKRAAYIQDLQHFLERGMDGADLNPRGF